MATRSGGTPQQPTSPTSQDVSSPSGALPAGQPLPSSTPADGTPPQPEPDDVELPDLSRIIPIGAPSQRPGEPVTHGADRGPGATSAALNLPDPTVQAHRAATAFVTRAAESTDDPMLHALAGVLPSRF